MELELPGAAAGTGLVRLLQLGILGASISTASGLAGSGIAASPSHGPGPTASVLYLCAPGPSSQAMAASAAAAPQDCKPGDLNGQAWDGDEDGDGVVEGGSDWRPAVYRFSGGSSSGGGTSSDLPGSGGGGGNSGIPPLETTGPRAATHAYGAGTSGAGPSGSADKSNANGLMWAGGQTGEQAQSGAGAGAGVRLVLRLGVPAEAMEKVGVGQPEDTQQRAWQVGLYLCGGWRVPPLLSPTGCGMAMGF